MVVKSWEIIAANFDDMSLKEAQLLALAISQIADNDVNEHGCIPVTVDRSVLHRLFNVSGYKQDDLKILTRLLQTRAVTVQPRSSDQASEPSDFFGAGSDADDEHGAWRRMVIVPNAEYINGTFTLEFNGHLKDHLLAVRDRMISYSLSHVIDMSSAYHIRLYEILMMGMNGQDREFEIDLDRLQRMMGAYNYVDGRQTKPKYARFSDFRYRVLAPSVEAINARKILQVEFKTLRTNRSVDRIWFHVRFHSPEEQQIERDDTVDLGELRPAFERLVSLGLTEVEAHDLLLQQTRPLDEVCNIMAAADEYIASLKKHDRSVAVNAIFKKAFSEAWQPRKKVSLAKKPAPSPKPNPSSSPKAQDAFDFEGSERPRGISFDMGKAVLLLETNEVLAQGLIKHWEKQRNSVSQHLYRKDGFRSSGLKNDIREHLMKFIKAGLIDLEDVTS